MLPTSTTREVLMHGRIRTFAIVAASVGVTAVVMTALQPGLVQAAGSNADTVDGFHATKCSVTRIARAGKLVATCGSTGRLPNNIIAKAPDSSRLGGRKPSAYLLSGGVSTRHFSCGGNTMVPESSAAVYQTEGPILEAQNGGFRCNLTLPDGAKVTKAMASMHNSDSAGFVTCAVVRNRIDVPSAALDAVALIDTAEAGSGDVVLSTTSITNGTIDNARYVYRISCVFASGADAITDLGVYGVSVTYTVTAAKG
jgi:hypothetical protein